MDYGETPMTTFDQEIMARTAMGEARSQGQDGMVAVMWTGINRFNAKKWFSGLTIAGTFLKRLQFDCWTPEDVNYAYIVNITEDIGLFHNALLWASQVIAGIIPDPTLEATHYYDDSIAAPEWTKGATLTVKIGRLTFWKDVE